MNAATDSGMRGRTRALLALATLLLLAFAFQGLRGLWSPDEGRYTNVALEMLRTGDWLHPQLSHEVSHFSKPPLTYWALATSIGTFGTHEWAARLPNTLAWLLTVLMVFASARLLQPARPWLAPLVYASFLLPYIAANVVTTDTLLAATVSIYVYGFLAAGLGARAVERRRGTWLLWLGAALAFLAKGPPGLLPLAGLLAFAWTERGQRPLRATWLRPLPMLVALLLAMAWYAKVGYDNPGLLRYFVVEEVWNRVASSGSHRNANWYAPLTIYGPTLLLGSLPWVFVLLARAWRLLHAPRASWRACWADPDCRRLLLWFGLPFVVFVLAKSRLPFYLLPLFQPLAFAVAHALRAAQPTRGRAIGLALWLGLLLALRGGAAMLERPEDDRALAVAVRSLPLLRIDEIAFVDSAPRYGLAFYLGIQVERVEPAGLPLVPQSQDLQSELAEDEGCRLLLVEPAAESKLRAELGVDAPGHWRELPAVGRYRAYFVDDGRCATRPVP